MNNFENQSNYGAEESLAAEFGLTPVSDVRPEGVPLPEDVPFIPSLYGKVLAEHSGDIAEILNDRKTGFLSLEEARERMGVVARSVATRYLLLADNIDE